MIGIAPQDFLAALLGLSQVALQERCQRSLVMLVLEGGLPACPVPAQAANDQGSACRCQGGQGQPVAVDQPVLDCRDAGRQPKICRDEGVTHRRTAAWTSARPAFRQSGPTQCDICPLKYSLIISPPTVQPGQANLSPASLAKPGRCR